MVALADSALSIASPALSPAAERMRRHRKRRRNGLHCLTIELRETEVHALMRKGFLAPESGPTHEAVRRALYAFLESALGRIA
jgi:hypothetical protein